jgi:hypothetical protein
MSLKVVENIVVNADGTPADYFVFSVKEKIGLPNYSAIDLFASIGRYIDIENIDESKQSVIEEVEDVIAVERDKVVTLYKND